MDSGDPRINHRVRLGAHTAFKMQNSPTMSKVTALPQIAICLARNSGNSGCVKPGSYPAAKLARWTKTAIILHQPTVRVIFQTRYIQNLPDRGHMEPLFASE